MKSFIKALLIIAISALPINAEQVSLTNVVGQWQDGIYQFSLGKNYTSSVVIFINQHEAYVFNGIYTIEKENLLRININEMKSVPRAQAFAKKGFSKTVSSRFIFFAEIKTEKGKSLILKPKEIVIDGNNSDGYFDKEMTLKKK